MGLRRAIPSAAGVGAVLLCASGAAAQATTSVCMDGRMATSISQYRVGSLEYEMLMINYKMGVADSLNIPGCNQAACPGVVVKVPPDCTPPPPPAPTRPVVTRPGMPPPPPPPPPPPAQAGSESVQGSFALAVSPEYAAAICQHGSEEQRTMIESVQEQTAARLSEQAGCNSRTRIFVDNKWEVTCGVCRDTCFQADSVQIDPSMFGCAPVGGQQVTNELSLTVSDAFAATLCAGPGSPDYDRISTEVRRTVAEQLGISIDMVTMAQIASGLDCEASHTDREIVGNQVDFDISPEYAHELCDPNSAAFAAFKLSFRTQIAASINGQCEPTTAANPNPVACAHITFDQIQVQDEDIFNNAHCADMASGTMNMGNGVTSKGVTSPGPTQAEVDAAAEDSSSGFDLAILVLIVACVGAGYRHKNKKAESKYQAVNADEEIPLSDYSIDGPSDGADRDRRENPSFGSQAFGSARIGSGKRR